MTGAYMTWTYGPAGWIDDLNEYIGDASKTNPDYNWEDMLEACAILAHGTVNPAARLDQMMLSNGASRGAMNRTI